VREYQFTEMVKKELPGVEVVSVTNIVAEMRKAKSAAELSLLQKRLTSRAKPNVTRRGQ
jgi:Xaa-Pro aminopeptidase